MKILFVSIINYFVFVSVSLFVFVSFIDAQQRISTPSPTLDDGRFKLTAPIIGVGSSIISQNAEFTIPLSLSVESGEPNVDTTGQATNVAFFGSNKENVNNDAYRGQFGFGIVFNSEDFEVVSVKLKNGSEALPFGGNIESSPGVPIPNPFSLPTGTDTTSVPLNTLKDFPSYATLDDIYNQQAAGAALLYSVFEYSQANDQFVCPKYDIFADEADFDTFKNADNKVVCVGVEYTNQIDGTNVPGIAKPLLFENTIDPIEITLKYIGTSQSTIRPFAALPSTFIDADDINRADKCNDLAGIGGRTDGPDGISNNADDVHYCQDFVYPWGTSKGTTIPKTSALNSVDTRTGIQYAEYVDYTFGPNVAPTLTGPTYVQSDDSNLVSNEFYNSINAKIVVSDANGSQSQVASYKTVDTAAECDTNDVTVTPFGNSISLVATSSSVTNAVREGVFTLSDDALNGKYLCIKISDSLGAAKTIVSSNAISSLDTTSPTVAFGSPVFTGGSIQSSDANESYVEIPIKINNGTDGTSASLNAQDEMTIAVSGGCSLPSIYSNASPGLSLLEPSGNPLALKYTTDPTNISGAAGLKFRFALSSGSYNCTLSVTDRAGNSGTLQIPSFTFSRQATLVTDITASLVSKTLTVGFNDETFADAHTVEFSSIPFAETTCNEALFNSGLKEDPYSASAYEIDYPSGGSVAARSGEYIFASEAVEESKLCVRVTDTTESSNPVYLATPVSVSAGSIELAPSFKIISFVPTITYTKKAKFTVKVDQPVTVGISEVGCNGAEISPTSIDAAQRNTDVEFTISGPSNSDLMEDTTYDCSVLLTGTDVVGSSTFSPSNGTATSPDGNTSIANGSFYVVGGASISSLTVTPDTGTNTSDGITNIRNLSVSIAYAAAESGDKAEVKVTDSNGTEIIKKEKTANAIGQDTFITSISLPTDGTYTITPTAISLTSGTRLAGTSQSWTVDTVSPTFDIELTDATIGNDFRGTTYFPNTDGSNYRLTNVSSGGTNGSAIESVTLNYPGGVARTGTLSGNNYSFPASPSIAQGSKVLTYTVTDVAGNSTSTTKNVVIDTVAPTSSQTSDISVKNGRAPSFDLLVNHNQVIEETLMATFAGTGSKCSGLSLKNTILGSGTTEETYKISLRGATGSYTGCTILLADRAGNSFLNAIPLSNFRITSGGGGGGRPGGAARAPLFKLSDLSSVARIQNNVSKEYKLGNSDQLIKRVQIALNNTECKVSTSGAGSRGKETEYFGQRTRNAIICYQAKNGLVQTGTLNKATYAKLLEVPQTSSANIREKQIMVLRAEIVRVTKMIIDLLEKRIKDKKRKS